MAVGRVRRGVGTALAAVLVGSLPVVVSAPPAAASLRPVLVVASVVGLKAAKPKITGVLAVGSTLTAVPGKWSPKTKFSYQWLAAGKVIKKATKSTYKLTKAENGKQITVRVTGSLAGSRVSKASVASARVMLAGTPKVVGQAKLGSLVRVSLGKWSSSARLSAGWLRDGKPISGATKSSYLVVAADEGHKLSVKVTGKRSGYATVSKTSAVVKVPKVVPPPPTPTISGTPMLWSRLTAYPGTWADGTSLSFQWLRNGEAIPEATSATYLLMPDDVKQQVSVTVTGKLGSTSASRTSESVSVSADSPPTISGSPVVGSTLTVDPGLWAPDTQLSYQWTREGSAIAAATSPSYTLVAADAWRQVSVIVTGRLGSTTVTKAPPAVSVRKATLQADVPTISGEVAVSKTVTAVPGAWTDGTAFTYQWYAGGVAIPGATASTLRPGYREAGLKLAVNVTGSKDGYLTTNRTSMPTTTVPTDANYEVGVDIPEGTYSSAYTEKCGWSQLLVPYRPQGGNAPGDTIGHRRTDKGVAIAGLARSRPWFWSQNCGRWTPVSQSVPLLTTIGDGDYLVGSQVQPGAYSSNSISASCVLYRTAGASGSDAEVITKYVRKNNETTATVPIPAGTYRVISAGCGTWNRVGDTPPDP